MAYVPHFICLGHDRHDQSIPVFLLTLPVYFPIIMLKPFLWMVEIPTSAAGIGKDLGR